MALDLALARPSIALVSHRFRQQRPIHPQPLLLPISAASRSRSPLLLHRHRPSFDAFMSFSGTLRHTIVDHLYAGLIREGIKPFKDDTEMPRGVNVKDSITAGIQDSRIYLVLLSADYASSSFCLDEAFEIMQRCGGGGGRVALPIFYHVSPEDVCDPTAGCFKEHFRLHFHKFSYERVQKWLDSLECLGNTAGFVQNTGRSEAVLVAEIASVVRKMVQEMRSTGDRFSNYTWPPLPPWLASSKSDDDEQHMELKYFEPQISSPQSNDKIMIRIPKPAYVDHVNQGDQLLHLNHYSPQLCLVAQHYFNATNDIATIATEARSLWKDDQIVVEPLEMTPNSPGTNVISGTIIIRFPNQDTRNWVLESSPWLIGGIRFFMRKWKGPLLLEPSSSSAWLLTVPMWVRLYNVPEEYMNPKGLSYIASALGGKPMYVDRATADGYYHSCSRSQIRPYAKVCVEISPEDAEAIMSFRPAVERTKVIAIGDEKENLMFVTAIYQLEDALADDHQRET